MWRFSMLWLLTLVVSFQWALAPAGAPERPRPTVVKTEVSGAGQPETRCCPTPWPPGGRRSVAQ
jgi:hypothetical protein